MIGHCIIHTCKTCGKATKCDRWSGELPPSGAIAQHCQFCKAKTDQEIGVYQAISCCTCGCQGPDVVKAVRG